MAGSTTLPVITESHTSEHAIERPSITATHTHTLHYTHIHILKPYMYVQITRLYTHIHVDASDIVEELVGILFLNHLLDGPANGAHILTTN